MGVLLEKPKRDYFGAVYWGALSLYCIYLALAGSAYLPAIAAAPMIYAILMLAIFWLAAGFFYSVVLLATKPAMLAKAFVFFIGRGYRRGGHEEERGWCDKTFSNIFFSGMLLAIAYAIYFMAEPQGRDGIFSWAALALFAISFLQILIATFPMRLLSPKSKGAMEEWAANARRMGEFAGTTGFFFLLLLFFLWAILSADFIQKAAAGKFDDAAWAVLLQFAFFLIVSCFALGKVIGEKIGKRHFALAIALFAAFYILGIPRLLGGMAHSTIVFISLSLAYLALALSAWDGWKAKKS